MKTNESGESRPATARLAAPPSGGRRPPTASLHVSTARPPRPVIPHGPAQVRARERRTPLFFVRLAVLVVVAAGCSFGVRAWYLKEKRGNEAVAKAEQQERATKARLIIARIDQAVGRATEMERELIGLVRLAAEAAAALGAGGDAAPASAPAAPADTQAQPPATPPPVSALVAGPPGEMTREQLDAARAGQKPSSLKIDEPPARPKPVRKTEHQQLADRVAEQAESAAHDIGTIRKAQATAQGLYNQLSSGFTSGAVPTLEAFTLAESEIRGLETAVRQALEGARRDAQTIDAMRKKVDEEKTARQEEQRRQEEERRRQQALSDELAAVEQAHTQCAAHAKRLELDEAVRLLTDRQAACQTDEGRAKADLLLERYTRIRDLHAFVVTQLNAGPFRWGWVQDASPRDVLGADAARVSVTGRQVPWSDVTVPQMLHFLKRSLESKSLSYTVRAQQSLSAAIYAFEVGSPAAEALAKQALELKPALQEDRARLLPADLAPKAAP